MSVKIVKWLGIIIPFCIFSSFSTVSFSQSIPPAEQRITKARNAVGKFANKELRFIYEIGSADCSELGIAIQHADTCLEIYLTSNTHHVPVLEILGTLGHLQEVSGTYYLISQNSPLNEYVSFGNSEKTRGSLSLPIWRYGSFGEFEFENAQHCPGVKANIPLKPINEWGKIHAERQSSNRATACTGCWEIFCSVSIEPETTLPVLNPGVIELTDPPP